MDLFTLLNDLFFDYTLRTVAMGTAVLGIVSGALGSFAMLRKQSLLGDAISHAALPGVVLVFMLTGSKSPWMLTLGAGIAGLCGMLLMLGITRYTRIKEDSGLGIILSVFFGLGLMLLTFLQRNPDARQAGLNTFLFGQAATLLERDVLVMGVFGGASLAIMLLFWKEFKLLSFDREFGSSLGFPMQAIEMLLTVLLVIAIVIGLQTVGVVLMSAMVVAPAAAARQWTDKLGFMVGLAAIFGAVSGVAGALISSFGSGLSTGPVIVLCISSIVVFSILFATNRGLVWNWLKDQKNRRTLRSEQVLLSLYEISKQHSNTNHPHSIAVLRAMISQRGVLKTLENLRTQGFVQRVGKDSWTLTTQGLLRAQKLIKSENVGEKTP